MKISWSRLAGGAVGLAIGAVFLVLSFHGTPLSAVLDLLAAGHWGEPALGVLTATAAYVWSKAARWRLLLGAASPPTIALLRPVTAGLALNALVPHSGEFVRAFSLQRRHGHAASAVLSSIVAERVFDLFGVLVLAACALLFVPVAPELLAAMRLLALVALALAVAVVASVAAPAAMRGLAARLLAPLPHRLGQRLLVEVDAALAGLAPVRSMRTSLAVFAWSLVQWLAIAGCTAGSAAVAGAPIAAPPAILVVVGIVVAFLLPNAPGYAGAVQLAFRVTLVPLGVAPEAALAASIVYQLLMVLPVVVVGLALLRGSLKADAIPAP